MIILFSTGRLGNQMFQYAFAKTIQNKNEKLVLLGFDELDKVFDLEEFSSKPILRGRVVALIRYLVGHALAKLADAGFISSIEVLRERLLSSHSREITDWKAKEGTFASIRLIRSGYFQSASFFNPEAVQRIKVREGPKQLAQDFLSEKAAGMMKIFVHFRRGDYSKHKVLGNSPLLPVDYFKIQMKWFKTKYPDCIFIFLSDSAEEVREQFSNLPFKIVISSNSTEVDFFIMTLCDAGILSASSFSWWGGYLMESKGPLRVPKNWLGFQSGIDYHSNPLPPRSKAVDVYPHCDLGGRGGSLKT